MNNILEYLEKTAKGDSWKTGVKDGEVCISWKEVMKVSQRIGSALSKRTQPGRPVAILMEKSVVTLTAMFGAVYAGCFYTVIDPHQPVKRIESILRVLSPEIILTDQLSKTIMANLSCFGQNVSIGECIREETDSDVLHQIRENSKDSDLLYCMFTSGSTGTPKGIVVSHRAVIDFISHFIETFQITENERIGNQAPFDFDVSVKDIYSCVFTGAMLVLIPQKLFAVPSTLLDYLCEKKITTLIWAASALSLISSLKGLQYRIPSSLHKIMFSGEIMPIRQLRIWQEALPEAEFINLYGPTEITCNCTYFKIDRLFEENEKIPIGKPFTGREVFLMSEEGRTIRGPEIIGEICVSGESLSNGYLNAMNETMKHFCKAFDGRIYYKTGDLGYWGADGELYFAGRKDFQIKIMGRRIELEEVECVLNQMEGVQKSCCILNRERNRLVAYFSGEADGKALRKKLKERLPAYMIPKEVIRMDQIPLNKNGKTDRAYLEALQGAAS